MRSWWRGGRRGTWKSTLDLFHAVHGREPNLASRSHQVDINSARPAASGQSDKRLDTALKVLERCQMAIHGLWVDEGRTGQACEVRGTEYGILRRTMVKAGPLRVCCIVQSVHTHTHTQYDRF